MGVPNHGNYSINLHGIKRYQERIDPDCPQQFVIKRVRTLMLDAEFLDKGEGGTVRYYNENENVCMVLDPSKQVVLTVYRIDTIKDSVGLGQLPLETLSPCVRATLAKASARERNALIRSTSEELAPLYDRQKELAELISRTLRASVLDKHYKELKRNRYKIVEIETKRDMLLNEYDAVINRKFIV